MAGDWIKMRVNLWDDPRVLAMCGQINCNAATVTGALFKLWSLADQHSDNGDLPHMTFEIVDAQVGIPGFSEALASVGWLVETDLGLNIPHFDEHNGESAKKRATTWRRVARHRAKREAGKKESADQTHPVTHSALPKEEKSRVEKKSKTSSRPKLRFEPEDLETAEWMFEKILALNPDHKKPDLEKWADDIRLMRERDERRPEEIRKLFEWCNNDPFWKSNILSPTKLRAKWDELQVKRLHTNRNNGSTSIGLDGIRKFMEAGDANDS